MATARTPSLAEASAGTNGTIVCAIDDSEGAEAALVVGRRLAERFEARVLLVTITEGGPQPEPRGEEHRVALGDPAEAIAMIAAEEAADLILVGAHAGRLGLASRSLLARDLASTAACPVVVVPPEAANRRA